MTEAQKQNVTNEINLRARMAWEEKQTDSVTFDDAAKTITASASCTEPDCEVTIKFSSEVYDFGDTLPYRRMIADQIVTKLGAIIIKNHIN